MLPAGAVLGYAVLLVLSGLVMLVVGGIGFRQGVGVRILEVVSGLAFLAYAVYLAFFFDGGRVGLVFWVVLGPILAVGNVQRVKRDRRVKAEQLAATYAAEALDRQPAAPDSAPGR
jgi:hypothetical protein